MNIAGHYYHSEVALFALGPSCGEAFDTCRSAINIFFYSILIKQGSLLKNEMYGFFLDTFSAIDGVFIPHYI